MPSLALWGFKNAIEERPGGVEALGRLGRTLHAAKKVTPCLCYMLAITHRARGVESETGGQRAKAIVRGTSDPGREGHSQHTAWVENLKHLEERLGQDPSGCCWTQEGQCSNRVLFDFVPC